MKTRRDVLKFAGGSALGLLFTPAPWRLITDTALWSENWPGIPRPRRGEITSKLTNCALCPAGCAVRARCVAGQPVSLAGVNGGLCALGVVGHHLPYHPDRVREGPVQGAAAAVKQRIAAGAAVAVLDLRPGRTASAAHRRAMEDIGGVYLAPPQPCVSVNLANARTVLSLSAPLLDGWASPAKVFAARGNFRLIQAEPVESRTATVADEWLPIRPGSERALARALAGEIPFAQAASEADVTVERLQALASELQSRGPALVIDRDMSDAVIAANEHFGSIGKTTVSRETVPAADLDGVPDGSIGVLLIDETYPAEYAAWEKIERKLGRDSVVVVFAWWRGGYARHAQFVLPVPVYPEIADDLPPAIDSQDTELRKLTPLIAAPEGTVYAHEFVVSIVGACAAHCGAGDMRLPMDRHTVPVLQEGELAVIREPQLFPVSPLFSKIYGESNLRLSPDRIALHPSEARACGVAEGGRAVLECAGERRAVTVTIDSGLRPGVVLTALPAGAARAKVVRA